MNEISLVILSVCLEAAVGIMLLMALGRLKNKDIDGRTASILATAFAVIGVVGSITHLGQPLRAFNSLLNLGSSWLSRETLCIMLFAACCVLYLAVNLWKPAMKTVLRVLEWAAALIGLVLLFIMGSIYHFASVPAWQGVNTYIEYYASAVILGVTFFFAATFKEQDRRSNKVLGAVALAALAIQIVSSQLHAAALSADSSSANGVLVAAQWILLFVGVGAFCLRGTTRKVAVLAGTAADTGETHALEGGSQIAWLSSILVFIAVFIGKVLFFSSMVTIGIGKP